MTRIGLAADGCAVDRVVGRGALMSPVSCVSWMYCVHAAETHETFHQESGMRQEAPLRRVHRASHRKATSRWNDSTFSKRHRKTGRSAVRH